MTKTTRYPQELHERSVRMVANWGQTTRYSCIPTPTGSQIGGASQPCTLDILGGICHPVACVDPLCGARGAAC
jgi:hypothetical protein